MKKALALILTLLIFTSILSVASLAADNRSIPKAATAPTIDGVKSAGEWDGALECVVNSTTSTAVAGSLDTCPDAKYYYMWDDSGLYFFGTVVDTTENAIVHSQGAGSYNSGDGIQLCIYPDVTMSGSGVGDLYFWSLVICDDGSVGCGEHFVFGSGSAGADVPDVKTACKVNGSNYDIEAFFPTSVWTDSNEPLKIATGTTFAMTNVVMEADGDVQSLIIDSAWFDANESTKYTLDTTVAGAAPAAAEEPTEEDPITVVEAPVAETPAAAQTSDLLVVAIIALGAVVVASKKYLKAK